MMEADKADEHESTEDGRGLTSAECCKQHLICIWQSLRVGVSVPAGSWQLSEEVLSETSTRSMIVTILYLLVYSILCMSTSKN
jgi:hypothetical protein